MNKRTKTMDFLQLNGKRFLIFGVANKKSVAYAVAKMLTDEGAECVFVVQNETIKERAAKLFPGAAFFTCDVEKEEEIAALRVAVGEKFDAFGFKISAKARAISTNEK
ncbi:MAG: SDR family oxidoreductase, partial [Thermoguttaceae bacterium]|nr:SDR family oxidoreductase [Thermoguttaceae bacterium]